MKRALVLVVVVMACSRHPLEKDDGGNAGTSGGGIAGVNGRGAAGAGSGGSAVAGSGGVAGAAGVGAGGTTGAAGSAIGGRASGGIGGIGGGAGGIGGAANGGIGGAANGGTGGLANGGAGGGAAGTGAAGGMAGSWCGGAAGALGACIKQVGQPCVVNAECATAQCADGVCCESACLGPCRSCNLAASVGRCMPVASGAPDSHGSCVATSPVTCGLDGTCDGSGGCRRYAIGSLCAAETCSADVYTPPSVCNGAGICVRPDSISCAPYRCSGSHCMTPCLSDGVCPSGFCEQGACCTTACQGPCNSCSLPGTTGLCRPVPNPDPSWNCPTGG